MGKAGKKDDKGWFPVSELAAVFGITPSGFRSSIFPLMPAESLRRDRKPALVHGPSAVQAVVRREVDAVERRLGPAEETQGELFSYLEEKRKWEAKTAELEYRKRVEELVELADIERGFAAIAEILRRSGEAIRVEFGDEAAKILNNAWEDARAKIDGMFALGDGDA